MPKQINQAFIKEIKDMWANGLTSHEIAEKVGKCRKTVLKYINPPKAGKPKKTATAEEKKAINSLYRDGVPIREIEKQLKISRRIVTDSIINKLPASVRVALGAAKAKSDLDGLAEYVDAVAPEMHRKDAILMIHRKQGGTFTEAENYYEAWRKEYLKRRAL